MKEPVCPKCNGMGLEEFKDGDKVFTRKCDCRAVDTLLSKCSKANIPKRFIGFDLRSYYPDTDNPSQERAKNAVRQFIDDYPSVETGLLLHGSIGLGKTQLLCCIAVEVMKKFDRIDVFYIDWNDLIRVMRSGEGHETRDFERINRLVTKLVEADLLLFDELAAHKVSPWVSDYIYYIINRRYNEKKITVFATNFYDSSERGQETLTQKIGDRIRSRLYEMAKTVEIKGVDFRQKHL
ncbi:MAG: ATP-binding protein [Candidatus Aminicenantes bacterium]|nr:ATP-binding protein [Candidatus Aminicenantes bacterium]